MYVVRAFNLVPRVKRDSGNEVGVCFEDINKFCAITVNQVSDIFESRSTDSEAHFKRQTFRAECNANEEKLMFIKFMLPCMDELSDKPSTY